jgi:hypothetical protein
MPAPVKHPALAVVGLGVIAFLCLQLLRQQVTLEAAAGRAVVTVLVLAAVDRLLVPIGRALVATPGRADRDAEAGDARPELDLGGGEPHR